MKLSELEEHATNIEALTRLLDSEKRRRDLAVIRAVEEGSRVQDVAYAAGVSQAKAYQIIAAGPNFGEGTFGGREVRVKIDPETGQFISAFTVEFDPDSGEFLNEMTI